MMSHQSTADNSSGLAASSDFGAAPFPVKAQTHIRVPATSANIGSGFDSLGLALDLWLHLRVSQSREWELRCEGEESERISRDPKDNFLVREFKTTVTERLGLSIRDRAFRFDIRNEIPLARGLGSSAAAAVAAIAAAYSLAGYDISDPGVLDEIGRHAAQVEGHPDNVIPAVFGGMQISVASETQPLVARIKCDFPSQELVFLVHVPHEPLHTADSRRRLPQTYDRALCARSIGRAVLLTQTLSARGPYRPNLAVALADELHEPFRRPLCRSFDCLKKQDAFDERILGVYLSGAGPASVTLCRATEAAAVEQDLRARLPELVRDGAFKICRLVETVQLEN